MNRARRRHLDALYGRLNYLEQRLEAEHLSSGYGRREWAALRWALKIVEEAEALGLLPQLEASNEHDAAAWLRRQDDVDRREREHRARKANRLAALQDLNADPDQNDAMTRRLPGSFEGGKGR